MTNGRHQDNLIRIEYIGLAALILAALTKPNYTLIFEKDELHRREAMEKADARAVLNINLGWKFHLGDEPRAWQKGFDDGNGLY